MKALTLHRPWDQLILAGHKPVENRSWSTSHRGDLLLHAGKAYDPRAVHLAGQLIPDEQVPDFEESPLGIVGVATLVDVCGASRTGYATRLSCDCGPWAFPGQFHWRLENPRVFSDPVTCRGFQQLWTPPQDVLDALPNLTT